MYTVFMEKEQIEEIFNQTFADLAIFYRDSNIDTNLVSKYQVGQILLERGFTDMSYKRGGIVSDVRYLIASANAKDLSVIDPSSTQFGHVVLTSGSYFKVLDIYKKGNKTQIVLLNIPPIAIELFGKSSYNIEEDIIKKGRVDFETAVELEILPQLQTPEWKQRIDFPIGMSDEGEFFM